MVVVVVLWGFAILAKLSSSLFILSTDTCNRQTAEYERQASKYLVLLESKQPKLRWIECQQKKKNRKLAHIPICDRRIHVQDLKYTKLYRFYMLCISLKIDKHTRIHANGGKALAVTATTTTKGSNNYAILIVETAAVEKTTTTTTTTTTILCVWKIASYL